MKDLGKFSDIEMQALTNGVNGGMLGSNWTFLSGRCLGLNHAPRKVAKPKFFEGSCMCVARAWQCEREFVMGFGWVMGHGTGLLARAVGVQGGGEET